MGREFRVIDLVVLVVHLRELSPGPEPQPLVEEAMERAVASELSPNKNVHNH